MNPKQKLPLFLGVMKIIVAINNKIDGVRANINCTRYLSSSRYFMLKNTVFFYIDVRHKFNIDIYILDIFLVRRFYRDHIILF